MLVSLCRGAPMVPWCGPRTPPTSLRIAQPLLVVAPVSGRYLLEVKVDVEPSFKLRVEPRKNADRYTLHVVALRPATSKDRVRVGWFDVLERAVKLEYLRTMDGLRQAIPVYREAAAGWRAVGDDALEAVTLEALAVMTGDFPQFRAETALVRERLTELFTRLGERELQTINWSYLSLQYYDEGRLGEAKQAAARTQELAIEQGFRVTAARTERELGLFEIALGNYDRARELAQQAQDLAAAIPDRAIEASALSDLGRLDDLAGDLEAAVARNRQALELASGDASATAQIMLSLGFNHLRRGELDEAVARFEARLALARTLVRRDQEALTRLGLGDVHLARGDRDGARRSSSRQRPRNWKRGTSGFAASPSNASAAWISRTVASTRPARVSRRWSRSPPGSSIRRASRRDAPVWRTSQRGATTWRPPKQRRAASYS